jgi:hypothetical protein
MFIAALADFRVCCEEVLSVFSELIDLQYTGEDRDARLLFGKDRRGGEHEVPLMTLSIGVVTNEQRHFTHTAQISELATEMKAYAKTFSGSIYVVDRRSTIRRPGPPDAGGGPRARLAFGTRCRPIVSEPEAVSMNAQCTHCNTIFASIRPRCRRAGFGPAAPSAAACSRSAPPPSPSRRSPPSRLLT